MKNSKKLFLVVVFLQAVSLCVASDLSNEELKDEFKYIQKQVKSLHRNAVVERDLLCKYFTKNVVEDGGNMRKALDAVDPKLDEEKNIINSADFLLNSVKCLFYDSRLELATKRACALRNAEKAYEVASKTENEQLKNNTSRFVILLNEAFARNIIANVDNSYSFSSSHSSARRNSGSSVGDDSDSVA